MEEAPSITFNNTNSNTYVFNLNSDNGNTFNIEISNNDFLLILTAYDSKKEQKNELKCISTIYEIKKTKYFLQFENIKEIYEELLFIIKQNQTLVSINEKGNQLDLIFKIHNSKNEQIVFKLEKDNDLSLKNYIILKENFSELTKEVNQLKDKIFLLERDNFELKKDNYELKKEIQNIKDILIRNNQLNVINNKIENLNSLICNEEDNILIKDYINSKQLVKAELLYRLTRDGNSIQKFHQLCDNQGANLVLYRTQNGMKLGGFSPLSWDTTTSGYKNDWDTFVFSLTRREKYPKKSINYSIYCHSSYGPYFKHFGIEGNMELFKLYLNSTFQGLEKISNTDNNSYNLNEVEVFRITIT
jgi:hypothetical protein